MSQDANAPTRAGRGLARPIVGTLLGAWLALGGTLPALAQPDEVDGTIVVTTEILGALVSQLTGDAGEMVVLMPRGADPHTWEPSARDVEQVLSAEVVVSNGLDLEEGLVDVLTSAAAEGVTWFEAADHVTQLSLDGQGGEPAADDEHDHGATDPHIWTDPLAMAEVVTALAPVLAEHGVDVAVAAEALVAELEALDAEVVETLSVIPAADRKLVTGHRSLGYFARRYGFEQIGSVIGSLSTGAEPTARQLAELIDEIREHDVPAVFAEVGTPQTVAQAVAADGGAELVELSTSQLPEEGTYAAFITELASTVAAALGGEAR